MPHDIDGSEFHVGDIVQVECKITEIHMTEEYCNISLETIQKMYPSENRTNLVLNGKQVRLKNEFS